MFRCRSRGQAAGRKNKKRSKSSLSLSLSLPSFSPRLNYVVRSSAWTSRRRRLCISFWMIIERLRRRSTQAAAAAAYFLPPSRDTAAARELLTFSRWNISFNSAESHYRCQRSYSVVFPTLGHYWKLFSAAFLQLLLARQLVLCLGIIITVAGVGGDGGKSWNSLLLWNLMTRPADARHFRSFNGALEGRHSPKGSSAVNLLRCPPPSLFCSVPHCST